MLVIVFVFAVWARVRAVARVSDRFRVLTMARARAVARVRASDRVRVRTMARVRAVAHLRALALVRVRACDLSSE